MHNPNIQEQLNEEQLVLNAKRDPLEFNALYLRYVQPVYRYLYSRIGAQAEAEDATAQTFLSALEGFDRYRHDGHFAAWLFSIARRKAADGFRQSARHVALDDSLPGKDEDLLARVVRQERSEQLNAVMRALPEAEIEMLRLRFAAELGFAEIARLLNRSQDAVKKNLYRLLDRLQAQMEENHE